MRIFTGRSGQDSNTAAITHWHLLLTQESDGRVRHEFDQVAAQSDALPGILAVPKGRWERDFEPPEVAPTDEPGSGGSSSGESWLPEALGGTTHDF